MRHIHNKFIPWSIVRHLLYAQLCCGAVCLFTACTSESKSADEGAIQEIQSSPPRTTGERAQNSSSNRYLWCADSASDRAVYLVVTSDSLGPVKIGTSRAGLYEACPGLRDTTWSGAEGDAIKGTLLRFFRKDIGLIEWTDTQALSRLLIFSPSVATVSGLRVGSTMRDIRKHGGRLAAGYDESGVYVWPVDARSRLSFLLQWQASRVLTSPDDVGKHVEMIPDSAHVRMIILDARASSVRTAINGS